MLVNPMTYGVSAIRGVLSTDAVGAGHTSLETSLILLALFCGLTLAGSTASVLSRRV